MMICIMRMRSVCFALVISFFFLPYGRGQGELKTRIASTPFFFFFFFSSGRIPTPTRTSEATTETPRGKADNPCPHSIPRCIRFCIIFCFY